MRNFIPTSIKTALLLAAAVILSYSCSKDDDEYTFVFASPALYFNFGGAQTINYTISSNVRNISVSSTPEGWRAELNTVTRTVTITAPASLDPYQSAEDEDKTITPVSSGTLTLHGDMGKKSVSALLFVSLGDVVDMSGSHANSFVISKPATGYQISAARPDGSAVNGIESAKVVWATDRNLIKYTDYKNGRITFTTKDGSELQEGNALIGGFDADDNLLWCWHIWATAAEPEANAVQINGYTFMGCNLGAFGNSTADHEEILASYGLYYQWGRPTPFPRPRYYNCAGSSSQYIYDPDVAMVSMTVAECDDDNIRIAAAIASPLVFVTGIEEPWQGANGLTWRDEEKSVYDPCPAGWRVPQSYVFAGVTIDPAELTGDMETLREQYGWRLTDGAQSAFFFAGGRRSYVDGAVINMNTQDTPQPWEGFYWTSSADASRKTATGLFFDLDTESAAGSRIVTGRSLQLSNGLQVRCVREH